MRQIRLNHLGIVIRLVDKDMSGALLQTLIDIVTEQCNQAYPLALSPSSITQSMPGSGWYAICSTDLKMSVAVTIYDPDTYVRFVTEGLDCDMVFVVYRVETGRIPMESLIPNVTLKEGDEVVVQAVELPDDQETSLRAPELQSAAESLYRMQTSQWSSTSQNWTQEQLEKLRMAVEKYGRRWKLIASKVDFGEFTSQDLCSKWNELIKSSQVSRRSGKGSKSVESADVTRSKTINQFTTKEATLLSTSVAEYGQDWALISQLYDFGCRDAADLEKVWKQLQNIADEDDHT